MRSISVESGFFFFFFEGGTTSKHSCFVIVMVPMLDLYMNGLWRSAAVLVLVC